MNVCDCWGPDGHLDTKIDKFDLCHIYMSYASYVIICHIMTYDAYDIEIWHISILSILVSKRPSRPQQSSPFIRFWLKHCFMGHPRATYMQKQMFEKCQTRVYWKNTTSGTIWGIKKWSSLQTDTDTGSF